MYTFAQCTFLYIAFLLLGKELTRRKGIWVYSILGVPICLAFGVFYEASVGCISAIIGMVLVIWKWERLRQYSDKAVSVILLAFCAFVAFGFRANAFTILPAVAGVAIWKYKREIKSTVVILFSILIGFGFTLYLPKAMNIDTMSSFAAGFVWETVSTIQNMSDEKQQLYNTYLDDIFGDGTTQEALEKNITIDNPSAHINPLLDGPFRRQVISDSENTNKILFKYLSLIKEEPNDFIKTKCKFISNTLGIKAPLSMRGYEYNLKERMGEYHFNNSRQRRYFVDYFSSYIDFIKVFRIPWIMFLVAFCLLIVWRIKFQSNPKEITYYDSLFLIALFYYGAYIIDNQAFEFRYFFPSWLLLFLLILSLILNMCSRKNIDQKLISLVAVVLSITCLFGGYKKMTEEGDTAIQDIEENCKLICSNNIGGGVYYRSGNLYFVLDRDVDTEYPFFLRYYPYEGEMVNNDFLFSDSQVYTSFFTKKLAVKPIPIQMFNKLEFGQYYGEMQFWGEQYDFLEFVSIPQYIDVLDFNDGNWTNGYGNSGNCFLAADVRLENCLLAGKKIVLPDGKTTMIMNTEMAGGYQRIYTVDDLSVYGDRRYLIEE